jgi:hypothetical protein
MRVLVSALCRTVLDDQDAKPDLSIIQGEGQRRLSNINHSERKTEMTRFTTTPLMAAAMIAIPAFAMAQTMADIDANGDGVLTIDEVQVVFADVSTDGFSAMDLNADGALDADEVLSAQEAGLLPAS